MRNLFVVVFILTHLCVCSAKDKIVERPPFSVCNTQTVEIEKIVMSDTATIVYMKAFFRPNYWIRIASDTYLRVNEKKVMIQKSEGIIMDTESFMDSTGMKQFSLFFPPIDPQAKQIDFIESDCENCFKIWGIELNSKKITNRIEVPKEVKDAALVNMKEDGQIKAPLFNEAPAILKGKFLGYVPDLNFKVEVFVNNPITGVQEDNKTNVRSDGSFEMKVPMVCDMQVLLRTNFYNKYILLSPGKESTVYFDLQQQCMQEARLRIDKSKAKDIMYFGGAWANVNNQLSRTEMLRFGIDYDKLEKEIVGMSAEQYKAYVLNNMDQSLKKLNAEKRSPQALAFAKLFCKHDAMYQLFMGRYFLESAFRKANKLDYNQELKGYIQPSFDRNYYSFIKDFPVNDPVSLYSKEYGYMINSCKYALVQQQRRISLNYLKESVVRKLMQKEQLTNDEKEVAEYLIKEEYGNWDRNRVAEFKKLSIQYADTLQTLTKLTENDKLEINKFKELVLSDNSKVIDIINTRLELVEIQLKRNQDISRDLLIQFAPVKQVTDSVTLALMKRTGVFLEKYKIQISDIEQASNEQEEIKPLAEMLGTNKGIVFELMYTQNRCRGLDKYTPLSEQELKNIALLDNSFYAKYISCKNDELIRKIEENKTKGGYKVYDTPETPNDKLFADLLKPFEGKVILIDFWATWCGPCRMAMKYMEPVKKQYEGKDVVFVYVTDESSPVGTWQNMISDIHGEHFRLKNDQFAYLRDKFGAKGVPSYMVLNKKGEQVYFNVGFEGVSRICGLIDNELK
jgi:thiol-disulfide isomerase/thioredoxin